MSRPKPVRRVVWVGLAVTSLLSAISVVFLPQEVPPVVPAAREVSQPAQRSVTSVNTRTEQVQVQLPRTVGRDPIALAVKDPFRAAQPSTDPTPAQRKPRASAPPTAGHDGAIAPPVMQPPPAAAPATPAMNHRFVGRFRTPDGRTLTFLTDGDTVAPVEPGMRLRSGFSVLQVGLREIRLKHEAAGIDVSVAIPEVASL